MNSFLFGSEPIGSCGFGDVRVDHDGLDAAMFESWCEFEELRGKSELALCNAYENYIMNTSQSTGEKVALFEGVLGDVWKNVKEFFKKIGAKIKAWWNAVVKWFQSHFQNDRDFLKKYKDEISTRDISKFVCTCYEWPGIKKWDTFANMPKAAITKGKTQYDAIIAKSGVENWSDEEKEAKKEIDKVFMKEAKQMASSENYEGKGGKGKYLDAMKKSFRGKKYEDKKGLPGLSKDEMFNILEKGNEYIDTLKEVADDISSAADDYSDGIDAALTKAGITEESSSDEKTKARSKINAAIAVAKYSLEYGTSCASFLKEMLGDAMSESRSILGAILRYNDKESSKESFGYGGYNQNNTIGLMETFASF